MNFSLKYRIKKKIGSVFWRGGCKKGRRKKGKDKKDNDNDDCWG